MHPLDSIVIVLIEQNSVEGKTGTGDRTIVNLKEAKP